MKSFRDTAALRGRRAQAANSSPAGQTKPGGVSVSAIGSPTGKIDVRDSFQVRETLTALIDSGFDGYLSLEPHLAAGGTFGGSSGPAEFRRAAKALKDLLMELSAA